MFIGLSPKEFYDRMTRDIMNRKLNTINIISLGIFYINLESSKSTKSIKNRITPTSSTENVCNMHIETKNLFHWNI